MDQDILKVFFRGVRHPVESGSAVEKTWRVERHI
jgi:hypothetical protein